MPKSDFWKFDFSNGAAPWIKEPWKESEKIDSMSRNELIEYVRDFTSSPPPASDVRNLFQSMYRMTLEYGNGLVYCAQDIFILEMQQIFNNLNHRLKKIEKQLDCIYHVDDTTNVKVVMAENISTSDHTALFLVHRFMTQKQLEIENQRDGVQKLRRDLFWFKHRLEVCIERKLNPGAVIPISLY